MVPVIHILFLGNAISATSPGINAHVQRALAENELRLSDAGLEGSQPLQKAKLLDQRSHIITRGVR
jgi:hypothetical protein